MLCDELAMQGSGISFMQIEAIQRIALMIMQHHSISHNFSNNRSRTDRNDVSISLDLCDRANNRGINTIDNNESRAQAEYLVGLPHSL